MFAVQDREIEPGRTVSHTAGTTFLTCTVAAHWWLFAIYSPLRRHLKAEPNTRDNGPLSLASTS
jgi:hypothetical protein